MRRPAMANQPPPGEICGRTACNRVWMCVCGCVLVLVCVLCVCVWLCVSCSPEIGSKRAHPVRPWAQQLAECEDGGVRGQAHTWRPDGHLWIGQGNRLELRGASRVHGPGLQRRQLCRRARVKRRTEVPTIDLRSARSRRTVVGRPPPPLPSSASCPRTVSM